jgi:hypothetical protein
MFLNIRIQLAFTNHCLIPEKQESVVKKIWLFFVPRKVRFLAMTMFEQARHCSFGLTKTFYKRV